MTEKAHIPVTPRGLEEKVRAASTPSFAFGINFSPSFHFGSPMNVLNGLSPHILKGIERPEKASAPEGSGKEDVFDILTPPSSSKCIDNKFLESLSKGTAIQQGTNTKDNKEETNSDKSLELWSLHEDSQGHNQTNLTSIVEAEYEKENFLSPSKLILASEPKGSNVLRTSKQQNTKPEGIEVEPSANGKVLKKSQLNDGLKSPSSAVATKVDALKSPRDLKRKQISRRKSSEVSSVDKVWNPDLDRQLCSSYLKYKNYRKSKDFDGTEMKLTSQNKVISRMLYQKTGMMRSTKQIASRLFRLSRMKNSLLNELLNTSPIDEASYASTPINISNEMNQTSIRRNIEVDNYMNSELLSSPSIHEDLKVQVWDLYKYNYDYNFSPNEFTIRFRQDSPEYIDHSFLDLVDSVSSIDYEHFKESLGDYIYNEIQKEINKELDTLDAPLILFHNLINLDTNSDLEKQTPESSISPLNLVNKRSMRINYDQGIFSSYMKLDVKSKATIADFLSWKCVTKVFKGDRILVNRTDNINGYKKEHFGTQAQYELEIPFLKDFWSGYLSFINDGLSDLNDINEIHVIQIFYERCSSPGKMCKPYGIFVHKFGSSSNQESKNGFSIVNRTKYLNSNHDTDENETVLALSSPLDNISGTSNISPLKKKTIESLSIDISQARTCQSGGPLTEPIYNSEVLRQHNLLLRATDTNECAVLDHASNNRIDLGEKNRSNSQRFISTAHPGLESNKFTRPLYSRSAMSSSNINNHQTHAYNNQLFSHSQIDDINIKDNFNLSRNIPLNEVNVAYGDQVARDTFEKPFYPKTKAHNGSHMMDNGENLQNSQAPGTMVGSNMVNSYVVNQIVDQPVITQTGENMLYVPYRQLQAHPPLNGFLSHPQNMVMNHMPGFQINQVQSIVNPAYPFPGDTTRNEPANPPKEIRETQKGNELTFCPIMEYDPSKDVKNASGPRSAKSGMAVHKFPVNTPVSIYKPKK